MIKGLTPSPGGRNGDFEVVLYFLLADKVGQLLWPQVQVDGDVFIDGFAGNNTVYIAPPLRQL